MVREDTCPSDESNDYTQYDQVAVAEESWWHLSNDATHLLTAELYTSVPSIHMFIHRALIGF